MVRVLGVDVDSELLEQWQAWLAPEVQPFFVESLRSWPARALAVGSRHMSAELRDTYRVWRLDRSLEVLWFDEATFLDLPRSERAVLVRSQARHRRGEVPSVRAWTDLLDASLLRSQADGHRFVWWPSLVRNDPARIVTRVISPDGSPSRHREVADGVWARCSRVLPAARNLAGTWPAASGPNCFGTVMGAVGVDGAADEWMLQEPFEAWLGSACSPGGKDDDVGTVLVWRNTDGLPVHAAVTIGDGWALEKPSQTWSTPRVVLGVGDLIRANRSPGQRLERHHL